MDWWLIIGIILRTYFGLNSVGFFVGMFLHDKHKVFEKIYLWTGLCALYMGLTWMFVYAVMGSFY